LFKDIPRFLLSTEFSILIILFFYDLAVLSGEFTLEFIILSE